MNNQQMISHFVSAALDDALATGDNQIFLSSLPQESEDLRTQVVNLAALQGVRLTGDPLILANGAAIQFLLVSSKTIAGYSGHTYALNCFDETNFADVSNLVLCLAMHEKYRTIFYSFEP